jgi:uncharacterized protein (TIGR03067 family)
MGWILLAGLGIAAQQPDDYAQLNGTWRVTALVENGKALTAKQIQANFVADQTVTFDGPTISYRAPDIIDPVRRPFTLNAKAEPKEIDMIGGQGGREVKGIYGVFGDSMMICFPTADSHTGRPSEFSSLPDSHHVILTLKRVAASAKPAEQPFKATSSQPGVLPVQNLPPAPVPVSSAERIREALLGTWGHQTEDAIAYMTFNPDGTYSSTLNWKSGFKRTFHQDVRSSGNWRLENNNTIVVTITASTSAEMRGQIYSARIVSMTANELNTVDGMGRIKRDWKVR